MRRTSKATAAREAARVLAAPTGEDSRRARPRPSPHAGPQPRLCVDLHVSELQPARPAQSEKDKAPPPRNQGWGWGPERTPLLVDTEAMEPQSGVRPRDGHGPLQRSKNERPALCKEGESESSEEPR